MQATLADCWAKTDPATGLPALTVLDHGFVVGAVGEVILKWLAPSARHLPFPGIATVAAIHDIGKISPGFQSKCPLSKLADPRGMRHEGNHAKLGQAWLGTLTKLRGADGRPPAWTLSVGAHHGGYHPSLAELVRDLRAEAESFPWAASLRRELLDRLIDGFGPISREEFARDSARLHWLTGFVTFADWIGSNTDWFPLAPSGPLRHLWTPEQARRQAGESFASLGWHRREVKSGLGFGDLFEPLDDGSSLTPRPLQEALIAASEAPGLCIVEAPMGMGKTEAALAAAYRRWSEGGERGLYFALPTQLTSNRIHDRITGFLDRAVADRDSVQALVHGNAWLFPDRIRPLQPTHAKADGDATDAHRWFASGRRALLAPFGTGTIDQALMAVMAAKHSALRLFALSGKAVVIDEVHSYDPYTSALVDRLVKHLLEVGCSVFVLSATLTARRRRELVAAAGACVPEAMPEDYPLITRVKAGSPVAEPIRIEGETPREATVRIERRSPGDPGALQSIADAAESGACVLVIRNTVRSAQETYLALKSLIREGRGIETGLIHSRFTFLDRQENERLWMENLGRDGKARPKHGAVLVATQVVEQSVDIDADLLVTDLAPVDLLIQRLGRLHRHRRESRPAGFETPVCWLWADDVDWTAGEKEIKASLGPSAWVYPPFALFQAERIFGARKALNLPTEIRSVLEESDRIPEGLPEGARRFRESLDEEVEEMKNTSFRRNWANASALQDIEGMETRWNVKRSGFVVLLAESPVTQNGLISIRPKDGDTISIRPGEFSYPLAKALHENAVRVPWYLVESGAPTQPKWLSEHIDDVVAVKILKDCMEIEPISAELKFVLKYSSELGLTFEAVRPEVINRHDEETFWF